MTRTTNIAALMAVTALVAGACSSDPDDGDATGPGDSVAIGDDAPDEETTPERVGDDPERVAKVRLRQFDECGAFLDYVHTEGAERVGAFGFEQRGGFDDVIVMATEAEGVDVAMDDEAMEAGGTDASAPAPATSEAGSDTFSETNNQVAGVDEPDIVKTDGARVLALTDGRLVYIDIDDEGRAAERRGSVELLRDEDNRFVYGQELLLAGDRAFVIGNVEGTMFPPPDLLVIDDGDAESSFVDEPLPTQSFPGPGQWAFQTVVVEVDISDPDAPAVTNTLTLDGRYVSARAIGDTARVVVSSPPQELGFLYPSGPGSEDRAIETNRELIRDTTIDDWVPTYTFIGADGSNEHGALVECDRVHAPAEFAGFDMLSVVTLATDESLSVPTDTTSVMASGDTVYASQDRLYVATNEWLPPTLDDRERGIWEETYQTGIHRFALPADAGATYEASGTVDGHLLNQFAMHDHDGTFFVATTTGTPWSQDTSVSQIVSMQPNGDRLEQIGQVGDMGAGERIFSVRYVGDTAYVVTFRQVDPFYVVDLSAPTDLVVRGELKIPGFSNYLHPISDSLVLGVGQDATDEGFTTGSKVSLFDVSDPSDPQEIDVWTLPGSNSDAEFDHRAFLWWEATSTAVLPLVSWNDQFAGAVVLNVTADGIEEQGRVSHLTDDRAPIGVTDCRVLTSDDFPDESFGELFWIVQDPGAQVQACGPDDQGGATGFVCDPIPVDEIDGWFFDASVEDLDTEGIDRFEFCWQDGGFEGYDQRVIRSLVIGDQLWTLSPVSFQANDLATLDRTARVDL